MRGWVTTLALVLAATPAVAGSLTMTLKGVATDKGTVVGQLCTDQRNFPGGACPFRASAKAQKGEVKLEFENVPDGRYAFQAFHDIDGNMKLDLPNDGFAFGNSTAWPPNFEKAGVSVAGSSSAEAVVTYFAANGGAAAAPEVGAPPRPGIIKTDLRQNGLYGALYAPAGARNLPVIIAIGGSEGGLDTISGLTSSFASHGYAVLALAYWRAPGLPQTLENVPLEYFTKALDWVQARPEVDKNRIGMFGWSRGGEGALLVSSREPRIKAVVGMSPGSHVLVGLDFSDFTKFEPAWTVGGVGLPYYVVPGNGMRTGMTMRQMMDLGLAEALKYPEAEIPVEKINGPILMLNGSADAIWDGAANSERVLARLKSKRFRHEARQIEYPGAGHLVFSGDEIGQRFEFDPAINTMMGGSDAANAAARKDAWEKTLAFFDKALNVRRR